MHVSPFLGIGDVPALSESVQINSSSFAPRGHHHMSHLCTRKLADFISTPVPPTKSKGRTIARSRVLTSAEHLEYLKRKEEEKRNLKEEKERRKKEREAKRNQKLAEKEKRKLISASKKKKKASAAGDIYYYL